MDCKTIKKSKKKNLEMINEFSRFIKENIVMVPVVASVLVGTFTGVKYIVNLTDTINGNRAEIEKIKTVDLVNIQRDMAVLTEKTNTILQKLERAEGTWKWLKTCMNY
jgi:hypothetical protein